MSADLGTPLAPAPAAVELGRGSLLRAEARRLRARRAVRVLLALGLLALLAAAAIASTQYATTTPEALAAAAQDRQDAYEQQQRFVQECLAGQTGLPEGVPPEQFCGGGPATPEDFGPVEQFLDEQPFTLQGDGRSGLLAVTAGAGVLAFLVGATYVGAEWTTRSMVALLFWEPRRLRVMGTKLAVLAGACALVGVLATSTWLLAAWGLAATRGTTAVPAGTWGELLGGAGRGVPFVVLVGLLGFGVANLLRNTGAAFGLGFVYFAVVENVVRALRPTWQPYLLTNNAAALLQEGGSSFFLSEQSVQDGVFTYGGREVLLSNLHGAVVLTTVTLAVVALGVLLFARRDLD